MLNQAEILKISTVENDPKAELGLEDDQEAESDVALGQEARTKDRGLAAEKGAEGLEAEIANAGVLHPVRGEIDPELVKVGLEIDGRGVAAAVVIKKEAVIIIQNPLLLHKS